MKGPNDDKLYDRTNRNNVTKFIHVILFKYYSQIGAKG